ncbi:MAG: hypothetical protein GX657_03465 [Chloroflexi bacterium]|jgi:hypothetical protein|nr:hypothetical protein [Chloroflexota bacterium]
MLSQVEQALAQVPAETGQAVGLWVAALLTLAVLSSVVGRNAFYRLAEALFVGIAAGYGAALAWTSVLAPRLALLLQDPAGHWHYALFFALGVLLVARSARRLSPLAGLPLGIMVGVGAGLALGGALSGSLVAQVRASLVSVAPADYAGGTPGWAQALDALLMVLGVVAVLVSYHFTAEPRRRLARWWQALVRPLRGVGRLYILVTFGVLLAGALLSFYVALGSRLDFLIGDWIGPLTHGGF